MIVRTVPPNSELDYEIRLWWLLRSLRSWPTQDVMDLQELYEHADFAVIVRRLEALAAVNGCEDQGEELSALVRYAESVRPPE